MSHTQGSLQLPIEAQDIDGDVIEFTVERSDLPYQMLTLDQDLQLEQRAGSYHNTATQPRKYLFSVTADYWYYLLPNGQLWSLGRNGVPDQLIDTFDPVVYAFPAVLHEATQPGNVTVDLSNRVLTLTPETDFVGTFQITITATDPLGGLVLHSFSGDCI